MSAKESFTYHLGIDFIRERQQAETARLRSLTGIEDPLPLDAGLSTALEIYGERAVTVVAYPGVLILRAFGVDVLEG